MKTLTPLPGASVAVISRFLDNATSSETMTEMQVDIPPFTECGEDFQTALLELGYEFAKSVVVHNGDLPTNKTYAGAVLMGMMVGVKAQQAAQEARELEAMVRS